MKSWISCLFALAVSLLATNSTYAEENSVMKQANPVVVVETNQGSFEITLFCDTAPKACENFLGLAQNHYYEGTIFHRIIKGFMIQGGDPTGTGTGGQSIWGKNFEDEVPLSRKFDRKGLLGMANRGPMTNGSQFFITVAPTPWLNQKHTIFGEITKGYDIVQKLETVQTDERDRPVQQQKILKVYPKATT